jgi:hypothetical protein
LILGEAGKFGLHLVKAKHEATFHISRKGVILNDGEDQVRVADTVIEEKVPHIRYSNPSIKHPLNIT